MSDYAVIDLIKFGAEQKPAEFEVAFKNIMQNKVAAAIDDKKIQLAQSIFNVNDIEETETEDTEDGETAE